MHRILLESVIIVAGLVGGVSPCILVKYWRTRLDPVGLPFRMFCCSRPAWIPFACLSMHVNREHVKDSHAFSGGMHWGKSHMHIRVGPRGVHVGIPAQSINNEHLTHLTWNKGKPTPSRTLSNYCARGVTEEGPRYRWERVGGGVLWGRGDTHRPSSR